MPPKEIRVRIAPSPTGNLHIGTARTALFNWLFAKKNNGKFVMRIEDTDSERSKPEFEENIKKELIWLGLEWDEIYKQSERREIYKKYLKILLEESYAYYCFCSKEERDAERQSMLAAGLPPKYSGKCKGLAASDVAKRVKEGSVSVIRFKMTEAPIEFTDMIRGKVVFQGSLIGDLVIAKSLSEPLYNFAAAIDDYDLKISHVIRAEDHLANTPKQIALYSALKFKSPHYAHLPLILNPDKSKMSKRFSAAAISDYRKAGYFPEALINYLALLGWHPEDNRELYSREDLITTFDLKRVQKAGASFNQDKLDWINTQYLKRISDEELLDKIQEVMELPKNAHLDQLLKITAMVRDRMKRLIDFENLADFIFRVTDYDAKLLNWKGGSNKETKETLMSVLNLINKIASDKFTKENIFNTLEPLIKEKGRGEVLWPARLAVSGKEASPGPYEIMDVLGKKETLKRIEDAINKLDS